MALSNPTGGAGLGAPSTATVTISDDDESSPDPGNLRFSSNDYQAGEGAGSVEVSVQRINGDDGAVGVTYDTSDGSAEAGDDYTATSGTLNWADNDDDAKTFTIPILDDGDDESDETINLTLSNPTGGAGLGNRSTAEVTILDDDVGSTPDPGNLGFSDTDVQVDENAGGATVTVDRSGGTDGAVSVDFATSDGSAEDGSDYDAANGTLSWADGDGTSKSFSVDVTDDTDDEGNETVNLALSNPSGGATLGPSSSTLTIVDDDQVVSGCVADDETLCLNQNGRFRVEVQWRDFAGQTGAGMAVTVTDTQEGVMKQYSNELGNPAPPVLDTAAFSTCP